MGSRSVRLELVETSKAADSGVPTPPRPPPLAPPVLDVVAAAEFIEALASDEDGWLAIDCPDGLNAFWSAAPPEYCLVTTGLG